MNIVFCVDRGVLPGLHVAAYSLLDRIDLSVGEIHFSVFSDVLQETDRALLQQTLDAVGKPFTLELLRVDPASLAEFPPLNGSLAAYYRLLAAQVMDVERFLYVDADTLCDIDVSKLQLLDMGDAPVAWVEEAPLAGAIDRKVAEQLGNSETEPYFNSGLMLVNVSEWRRQRITERSLEYIAKYSPDYHDQSALNYVLHGNSVVLDEEFNCITNQRKNWPSLREAYGYTEKLIHFVDAPKPWNFLGELVHPQYGIWRAVKKKTALKRYHSWHRTPARKFPTAIKAFVGYKKAFKDRLLFEGYSRAWLKRVKGL